MIRSLLLPPAMFWRPFFFRGWGFLKQVLRICPLGTCQPIKLYRRLLDHGIAGGLFGFLVLHPISMVVHDIFHLTSAKIWQAVSLSFSVGHLSMTAYFTAIGAGFGLIHGGYIHIITRLYEEVRILSITDELTGLYNRRFFMNALEQEFARSERYQRSLSLLMLDLDYFKHYNDTHGHQTGDDLLRNLPQRLMNLIRDTDIVARYGGEEFAVIMPETQKEEARKLAQRICEAVAAHPFQAREAQPGGRITLSIGVAEFPGDASTMRELIRKADESLYLAKENGRNRVWACNRGSLSAAPPL